jgi:hypothetical protein
MAAPSGYRSNGHSTVKHIPAAMIFIGLMLLAVVAFGQDGHPQGHDPYVDWKTRNGISCCHGRDCAPATTWADADGNWTARQNGQTYIVPPHAVLPIPSPDGRSHACVIGGNVICFVPGEVRG